MTPAYRLAAFALAVERLEELEARLQKAIEAETVVPGQIPESLGDALREQSTVVLSLALTWPDMVAATQALNLPEPSGGRAAYGAYLQSLAPYGSSTSELVQ